MLGLDYVMAGYFHLAQADIKCQAKKTPEISVVASDTQVTYDHTKTQEELDNFEIDTVSPYAKSVRTHVGGLMSGEVSVAQNLRIMQETFPSLNAGCLYLDKLTVKIHINPTIYIARNYPKNGCMYAAVMEHEKKHIKVDRMIVNKYTRIIIQGLDTAFKKIGYTQGPFTTGELGPAQEQTQKFIQSLLKQYSDQMSDERQVLQQKVDSLQEYERVQALCRGKK